jgi:hypothetical protein
MPTLLKAILAIGLCSVPALAQYSSPTRIVNTASQAVPVIGADAQNAFGVDFTFFMPQGHQQTTTPLFSAPAGKRMVIESITMYGFLDKTANFIVICQASLTGADPFNATVSFPTYVAPFSLPNGIAGGSAPVKIYANSISLNVNRTNNGGDSSGIVTITGHYELL